MRRPKLVTGTALATLLSMVVASGFAQEKTEQPAPEGAEKPSAKQAKCPVSGDPVDFRFSLMADAGPAYFCCPDCFKKFEADPKRFEAKVKAQHDVLTKLPKVQVRCPVSGKPISKSEFIEMDGQKIYFCCPKCAPQYRENPAKFKAKLLASYTYQTRCPVTGEAIDPSAAAEMPDGNRVYYCCLACDPQVRKEPAKYAKKLEEQGTYLDVKKIEAAASGIKKEGKHEGKEKGEEEQHHHAEKP